MSQNLPVRSFSQHSPDVRSFVSRAGWMVGATLFLSIALTGWGLGGIALASALVPVALASAGSGLVESARRGSESWDSFLPLALAGGVLGAAMGGLLAPLWVLFSSLGWITSSGAVTGLSLLGAASGGALLGGFTGATSGTAVGTLRKAEDPLVAGAMAGGATTAASFVGLYFGIFGALATLIASFMGLPGSALTQALSHSPTFLGSLGLALVAGSSAFSGTLTLKGASARAKRAALPSPESFPDWARADSVTRYQPKEREPTIYIS